MIVPSRASGGSAGVEAACARAEALARMHSSARQPLVYAAGLLRAQASVAQALGALHDARPLSGVLESDLDRIVPALVDVPRFAAGSGPEPLAHLARARAAENQATLRQRLAALWSGARQPAHDYLSRAMLRPYAEALRARGITPDRVRERGRCPFCGGAPAIGCRRGGGEGSGAGRFLACGLCGLEWSFPRIRCPCCFESDPDKLPAFTTEALPAVRLEACETCRRYVKSIDLSQDPRAVPEVDDLASLALDLWAGEQDLTRIEPGLAGL